MGKFLKVAPA